MTTQTTDKKTRQLEGTVVSTKMDKTVVVKIERQVTHMKYEKQYTISKKYNVHDAKGEARKGDVVSFVECRPISKSKRWRIVQVIKK